MKKYGRWILLILAGAFIIGLFFYGFMPSKSYVESQINTNIPIGSSKENVISFLESHGYQHSANVQPDVKYTSHKIITAISIKSYGFLDGQVLLSFQFDQQDKLLSYKVDKAWTFL